MTAGHTFTVHEVKTRDEFDPVVRVHWAAMHEPFMPDFPWFHPVFGYTEADRQASIETDIDRKWQSHQTNAASHWVYVTEGSSTEVIGVAEWQLYTENPFPNGPLDLKCTWFPEGETRDFVTYVMKQCFYARMNWMDRPHISLQGMAVLPNKRGRGVASTMMDWGMERANKFNLECFLEASDLGKDLYAKYEFETLMSFIVNTHKKDPSQTWTRLHHQFPPISLTFMWRPAPEDLRNGTTTSFWEVLKNYRCK